MYGIHLAKEPFKFSVSHFTIFSSEHAERLHGHNYQVSVSISVGEVDAKIGLAFDFNLVKPMIRKICDSMDERILIPEKSPFLKIQKEGTQVRVQFNAKKYEFPVEDTIFLPLVNVTTEELARYVGENLRAGMTALPGWSKMQINIEETRGQSVSYELTR
jgi:6-pyruvoyltetrahydropterin/6-carboxytetrahydropterin synthase